MNPFLSVIHLKTPYCHSLGTTLTSLSSPSVPLAIYGAKVRRKFYALTAILLQEGDEIIEDVRISAALVDECALLYTIIDEFVQTGSVSAEVRAQFKELPDPIDLNGPPNDLKISEIAEDYALFLHFFDSYYSDEPLLELLAQVGLRMMNVVLHLEELNYDSAPAGWLQDSVDAEKQPTGKELLDTQGSGSSIKRMENPNRKKGK